LINTNYEEKFGKKGLTFDDVLLIPAKSDIIPRQIKVKTRLTKKYRLISQSFRQPWIP